jgi:hypothetical protein
MHFHLRNMPFRTFVRGAIAVNRAIEAGQAFEFVGGYPEKDLRDHHFLEPRCGWCVIGLLDMMLSPTVCGGLRSTTRNMEDLCGKWTINAKHVRTGAMGACTVRSRSESRS